ncbi:signal peptidase I [Bacillaceae bacterium S4-13-58]
MRKQLWVYLRTILIAFVIAYAVRTLLFATYVVDGKSMEPTLHDGNLLMVNKVIYDWKDVNRFDVIVFHRNEQDDYVKRVIGIEGDSIEYKNDRLYVNGEFQEEAYLQPFREEAVGKLTEDFTLKEITGEATVPKGYIFVMGDNRQRSLDSRKFGFVPIDLVVGKVDARYWPISQAAIAF